MLTENMLFWFLLGMLPYHTAKRNFPAGSYTLELRALFWRIKISRRRSGKHDWQLRMPLIEMLRKAL